MASPGNGIMLVSFSLQNNGERMKREWLRNILEWCKEGVRIA
jgi:hypothetical protein